jgi:pyruvate/2-oxoglutarate dehydrogenase complex dihydrolipoamide dehydrogenase (E3) component
MASAEKYDFIALGAGEAGKLLSWDLSSKHGKKCAVIEHGPIAGACPTVACMPSKTLVHLAEVVHHTRKDAPNFVLKPSNNGNVVAKMPAVIARKKAVVDGLADMFLGAFDSTNVELIRGHGTLVGPKTISVNGRLLTADTIVVNTGSKAAIDKNIPGLVDAKPMTHVELLQLTTLPAHLIILGGGYVGLEFAQVFARLGSRVTVVERNAQVLKAEDADVIADLTGVLTREGVQFLTAATVDSVSGVSGHEVTLRLSGPGPAEIRGSHLVVATGRIPTTTGIGLVENGIRLTATGHVAVDEQLCTTVPGVFAVGDCAGSPYFTHIGWDDYRVVLASLTGDARKGGTANRQVPSVLFTSPELAHVGLREKEAQARGTPYRLAKLPMAAFLRTRALGDTDGFAKVLVEAEGDKVLGFTALGPQAGEMLPVVQLVMKLGLSYKEISELVIVHPTMCEGLVDLFRSVPERS